MAYPANYTYPYPTPYNPYFPQQFYPQPPTPQQTAQQQTIQQAQQPQIQNGGFMSVRTEEEAYNWPIAPGVGMTFKVESAPVIIDKSRGFSPLEQPVVRVYDMIERVQQPSAAPQPQEAHVQPAADYAERSDVEALRRELDGFRADLEALKEQPIVAEIKRTTAKTKKEADE